MRNLIPIIYLLMIKPSVHKQFPVIAPAPQCKYLPHPALSCCSAQIASASCLRLSALRWASPCLVTLLALVWHPVPDDLPSWMPLLPILISAFMLAILSSCPLPLPHVDSYLTPKIAIYWSSTLTSTVSPSAEIPFSLCSGYHVGILSPIVTPALSSQALCHTGAFLGLWHLHQANLLLRCRPYTSRPPWLHTPPIGTHLAWPHVMAFRLICAGREGQRVGK